MKVLCKCGGFYLSEGMICPVCGHELTITERYEHEKAQREHKKAARSRGWERCNFYESKEAEKAAMAEYRRAKKADDKHPVSATLISIENKYKNPLGALGRAMVGNALLGFWGGYLGFESAPSKDVATFSVRYASGRVGKETVEVGSERFRWLSALCD